MNLFDGLTALTLPQSQQQQHGIAPRGTLRRNHRTVIRLYLNDNRHGSTLDVDLFDGLVATLDTLDLTGNSITGLTAGVFEDLDVDSLKSLYLRSNRLASLPADIFDGLTGLTGSGPLMQQRSPRLTLRESTPFASTLDLPGNQRQQLHHAA